MAFDKLLHVVKACEAYTLCLLRFGTCFTNKCSIGDIKENVLQLVFLNQVQEILYHVINKDYDSDIRISLSESLLIT